MNVTKLNEYTKNGYAVFEDALPQNLLTRIRDVLHDMASARLSALGIAFNSGDTPDELLKLFMEHNPGSLRELIIAFRDHSIWYEVLLCPQVQGIAKQLLQCEELMIVHDACMFRIDPMDDARRLLNWHQEYPYILQGNPGLTLWIPVYDIKQSMGPLQFIPGSHQSPVPIEIENGEKVLDSIKPIAAEHIAEEKVIAPEVKAGTAIAMHGLTLHKSGINLDPNFARWVAVLRYSDMYDPNLVDIGWDVSRDKRSAMSLLKERYQDLIKASD